MFFQVIILFFILLLFYFKIMIKNTTHNFKQLFSYTFVYKEYKSISNKIQHWSYRILR